MAFYSSIFRYNREEVVRSLGKEINLNPPLTLGQLPDTPEELLKLDQVSIMQRFWLVCIHNIVFAGWIVYYSLVLLFVLGLHQIRTEGWRHLCQRESIQRRANSGQ